MNLKTALAVIAATAWLAGCAATTPKDLEGDQGSSFTIAVPAAPALVYRRIVERSRECLQFGQLRVDADFFADTNTGRVSLVQASNGQAAVTTTTVSPADAGGSAVRVSYYDPGKSHRPTAFAEPIADWANGSPGACFAERFRSRKPACDASRESC